MAVIDGSKVRTIPPMPAATALTRVARRPNPRRRPGGQRCRHRAEQIDRENRAQRRRPEAERRGGQAQIDEREGRYQREQHPEANETGSQQPPVRKMTGVAGQGAAQTALSGPEPALRRQRPGHDRGGDQGDQRQRGKGHPPAAQLGRDAADEAPGEAADDGAGRVQAGGADGFRPVALLPDIGDGDGEHERQQQSLDEAPQQQGGQRARQRHQQSRDHHRNAAPTISRLRPNRSDAAPANGAISATASSETVIASDPRTWSKPRSSPAPTGRPVAYKD